MSRLPVIVAAGGINPAGRISGHHAYRRLVFDAQPKSAQDRTLKSLATLMGMKQTAKTFASEQRQYILDHTLIRRIEPDHFDVEAIVAQRHLSVHSESKQPIQFDIKKKYLSDPLPQGWSIIATEGTNARIQTENTLACMLPQNTTGLVQSGGQLPSGFNPAALYPARNHPKGLSLALYAASDALNDLGIELNAIKQLIAPEQISVYAGSSLGQLDGNGFGGMFSARHKGRRITAKQLPLGLPEMPADFVNAYVLGSVGATGCNIGACATFLYNLSLAMHDIQHGRCRMSLVGATEAPLVPEIVEGFSAMGALAEDKDLLALDKGRTTPDYRRSCRPFGQNCGFTLAESGVFLVLMDDELALETGARILGGAGCTHVNADGFKNSISRPGIGNYATVAQSMSAGKAMLGEDGLKNRTYMQAHGTGTPQNRITESKIMSDLATVFGVQNWLISAVKAYIGHSLAPAGGDQITTCLGAWQDGIIPGIPTIDKIADDVSTKGLRYSLQHEVVDPDRYQGAFINSKGFGGNNATALILSPNKVKDMLQHKHGAKAWQNYQRKLGATEEQSQAYDEAAIAKQAEPFYHFNKGVLTGEDLDISNQSIKVPGFEKGISLDIKNPYPDMC